MMSSVLLGLLTMMLPLGLAIPIDHTAHGTADLQARGNPGSIYLCQDVNWEGQCLYIEHSLIPRTCFNIDAKYGDARSIGGDEGPGCTVYSQPGCKGEQIDVTFPGVGDVSDKDGWQGPAASYECYFKYDPPQ